MPIAQPLNFIEFVSVPILFSKQPQQRFNGVELDGPGDDDVESDEPGDDDVESDGPGDDGVESDGPGDDDVESDDDDGDGGGRGDVSSERYGAKTELQPQTGHSPLDPQAWQGASSCLLF